jgi:hypothetical protein
MRTVEKKDYFSFLQLNVTRRFSVHKARQQTNLLHLFAHRSTKLLIYVHDFVEKIRILFLSGFTCGTGCELLCDLKSLIWDLLQTNRSLLSHPHVPRCQ